MADAGGWMGAWVPDDLANEMGARVRARLEPRRFELESAILERIRTVRDSAGLADSRYVAALQAAVEAGVAHALLGVEHGAEGAGPIPDAILAEARQAARSGVSLDIEFCRYFAGYAVFCDFVMEAADEDAPLSHAGLRQAMRGVAAVFERLVAALSSEHVREKMHCPRPLSQTQVEEVEKLLAGDPAVDTSRWQYEFDDWHVGAIARGQASVPVLRGLAEAADRRLLVVRPERETAWGWLAGRRRISVAEIARHRPSSNLETTVVLGEPARGLEGWRLTHRQALAAQAIVGDRPGTVVGYGDVGLLASIVQDDLLVSSLRQLYLMPLAESGNRGASLRETLRAYFEAGRNVSSAASALGVSRQTVGNRLRAIEEKLGRTIESCAPEIEVALRLEALSDLPNRSDLHKSV